MLCGIFWLYYTNLLLNILEDTARYAGLLLAPVEGLGRGFFGNFWCPVVTLVTFSSNLSDFERNPKKPKKSKKNPKIKKKNQKIKKIEKKKI